MRLRWLPALTFGLVGAIGGAFTAVGTWVFLRNHAPYSRDPIYALFIISLVSVLAFSGCGVGIRVLIGISLRGGAVQMRLLAKQGICPLCDYDMRGCSSRRCPECGFDSPEDGAA